MSRVRARSKPISERQVFGRSVLLFRQVDRNQLALDVRTPSIADVFVACRRTDHGLRATNELSAKRAASESEK
jgi:hypothetical protein